MGNSATRLKPTNFAAAPTNFFRIDEEQAAQSFSAAVIDFDAYTLARAAGRNPETARLWKAGVRCPNGSSLINMALTIDVVPGWFLGEIESRRPHRPVTADKANGAYALLQQEAMQGGEAGVLARQMLAKLSGGLS